MSELPKSYPIIRSGRIDQETVATLDDVVRLRTEVAIIARFGRGADDRVVQAVAARLEHADENARPEPRDADDVREILQILHDAHHPAISETATSIDADFPDAARGIPLKTIHEEAEEFHKSVAQQIRSSGLEDAEALARDYLSAAGEATADSTTTGPTSDGDVDMNDQSDPSTDLPPDTETGEQPPQAAAVEEPETGSLVDDIGAGDQAADEAVAAAVEADQEGLQEAEAVLSDAKAAAVTADEPVPEEASGETSEEAASDQGQQSAEGTDDIDGMLDTLTADIDAVRTLDTEEADAPDETGDGDQPAATQDGIAEAADVMETAAEDPPDIADPSGETSAEPPADASVEVADEAPTDAASVDATSEAPTVEDASQGEAEDAAVVAEAETVRESETTEELEGVLDSLSVEAEALSEGKDADPTDESLPIETGEDVEAALAAGIEASDEASGEAADPDVIDAVAEDLAASGNAEEADTDPVMDADEIGVDDMLNVAEAAANSLASDIGSEPEEIPEASASEETTSEATATDESQQTAEEGTAELEALADQTTTPVAGPAETPTMEDLEAADAAIAEAQALGQTEEAEDAEPTLVVVEDAFEETSDSLDLDEADRGDPEAVDAAASMEHPIEEPCEDDRPPGGSQSSSELRGELDEIRSSLHAQLDRLSALLDRIDAKEDEAQSVLDKANAYKQEAESAREEAMAALDAQKTYDEARAEADRAQTAAHEAEARAEAARQELQHLLEERKGS